MPSYSFSIFLIPNFIQNFSFIVLYSWKVLKHLNTHDTRNHLRTQVLFVVWKFAQFYLTSCRHSLLILNFSNATSFDFSLHLRVDLLICVIVLFLLRFFCIYPTFLCVTFFLFSIIVHHFTITAYTFRWQPFSRNVKMEVLIMQRECFRQTKSIQKFIEAFGI